MNRLALLFASLLSLPAFAAPSAEDIINRASEAQYYAGADGRARVRMRIIDAQGRKMRRQFIVLRQDESDNGPQNFLVVFEKPADVRNTVFMVHKKPGATDDRWLYLPSLDLVKRIAAGDKRTSFVGSHLFYEDISGRAPNEDRHRIKKQSATHALIESTPKSKDGVEFDRYEVLVDLKTYLPMRIEYFKQTKLYRRIEAVQVKTVGGHPTITRMKVSDLSGGGHTLVDFRDIQFDLGVPKAIFREASLRQPPARWLQDRRGA